MIDEWGPLSKVAWACRENAVILGRTKVGAAVLTADGEIFGGCNVEHQFRSHDIHAEVNAIGTMVAHGHREVSMILIAAKRKQFTPCGACMDWIFEFGGGECRVGFQGRPGGEVRQFIAKDLMPHYPI